MKIRVNFTIDVENMEPLRELSEEDNYRDAALFAKAEAQNLLCGYLEDNGVRLQIIRDATDY